MAGVNGKPGCIKIGKTKICRQDIAEAINDGLARAANRASTILLGIDWLGSKYAKAQPRMDRSIVARTTEFSTVEYVRRRIEQAPKDSPLYKFSDSYMNDLLNRHRGNIIKAAKEFGHEPAVIIERLKNAGPRSPLIKWRPPIAE